MKEDEGVAQEGPRLPDLFHDQGEVELFNNIEDFGNAVDSATGRQLDFQTIARINTNFLKSDGDYLILNVKDVEPNYPDNLLFCTGSKVYLLCHEPAFLDSLKVFDNVLREPAGLSTVVAFGIIKKVLESFKQSFEALIDELRELQEKFDNARYRDLSVRYERFDDRLEEMHDLLLKLEEREVNLIDTRLISVDYGILMAEILSLQGRCARRINMLKETVREHEMQAANELNLRVERLSEVVRRLTAVTIVLMLPTMVASHYGMNFVHMPELQQPLAYPIVVAAEMLILIGAVLIFRKVGWL